ncbi:MAG TPA: hypothetical protein VJT73_12920 [Polyangiaceae bacterium]|nr:hypothetical protein [Polyangiaceae bacterium]
MNDRKPIPIPKLDTVTIELLPIDTLKLKGTITKQGPAQDLAGFFGAIHRDGIERKLAAVRVDVSELTFVDSSAIRLFVDWATWLKKEKGPRYTLHFLTSRHVTWQKTSFLALTALLGDVLAIDKID